MGNSTMELVKKYKVSLWLKDDESKWVRIRKSTTFDLQFNVSSDDRDYIDQQHPTTEITDYKPSLNQSITLYRGSDDYTMLFNKAYNLPVGEDAKTEALVIFAQEPLNKTVSKVVKTTTYEHPASYDNTKTYYSDSEGKEVATGVSDSNYANYYIAVESEDNATVEEAYGYKAWKAEASLAFADINSVDSTLTFDIYFNGDIEKGYATADDTTKQPVFTKSEDAKGDWVDPFNF